MGSLQLRIPVGGDVGLHSHLHAVERPDRRRHELVAGHRHHPARQPDRADSHAAQRACGRQVRHSLSGLRARLLRCARRQYSRRAPRTGGLRMVRHTDLDRRSGHLLHAQDSLAGRGRFSGRRMGLLLRLLGAEHRRHLARHRDHQISGRHRRALHAGHWTTALVVDHRQGRRPRTRTQRSQQVSQHRRIPPLLHSVAHRHGRLLGHRRAQHPRFHALRQIAEGADVGPGPRLARRHDALFLHRRGRHLRVGRDLRRAHLGSRRAARQIQSAGGRLHRAWSRCSSPR